MKNNGEEDGKLLVMGVADENKKAAENKIYKLSGFVNKKRFIYFIFCRFRARSVTTVNDYSLAVYTFSHLRIQNLLTNTE